VGTTGKADAMINQPTINQPTPIEEEPPVRTEVAEVVEDDEQPLATWARVTIVVVALFAFFAVSVIVTKGI
jgi:hypothetical protein